MDEKNKEEILKTSLDTLTKEEVLDTIKSIFKDNEESLKYIDNIISNLVELKRLSVANPTSTSLVTWIIPILLLFTDSWTDNQSEKSLEEKERENEID